VTDTSGSYGVLTKTRLAVWAVTGLLVVAAVAFLAGYFAAREDTGYFDWELASIFGTALGTTALALATGALAYTTSGDVRATWQLPTWTTRADLSNPARELAVVERGRGPMRSVASLPRCD
jgi:hypothetical protein